ncbi:hypothetical protein Tco_0270694 [Tanacetum coccineum]
MEQYLALTRGNQAPGVVKPEIGGNVNFEIKSQFIRELREDTFSGNKNDNAHEHVERVLDIVSLFNIPRVSHDAEPSIPGTSLRKPLSKGAIHHQRLPSSLKKSATSSRKETKHYTKLGNGIHDILYKCPTHDINNHQKVNIFYNGLGALNRQLLNSQGLIPGMTPIQALPTIQTMVDHSQKWHDGSSNRNIESSSNSEGIAAIVNKLENLGPPGYYTRMDNRPPVREKRLSIIYKEWGDSLEMGWPLLYWLKCKRGRGGGGMVRILMFDVRDLLVEKKDLLQNKECYVKMKKAMLLDEPRINEEHHNILQQQLLLQKLSCLAPTKAKGLLFMNKWQITEPTVSSQTTSQDKDSGQKGKSKND